MRPGVSKGFRAVVRLAGSTSLSFNSPPRTVGKAGAVQVRLGAHPLHAAVLRFPRTLCGRESARGCPTQWFILLFAHDERSDTRSDQNIDDAALDKAFAALEAQAREAAAALDGDAAVEAFRLEWLGRKQGRLNEVSGRWLKSAPA